MSKPLEISLPVFGIVITCAGKCGTITGPGLLDPGAPDTYNAAIDGILSLILAHACAGIDVRSPAYLEGIEVAVEAAGNRWDA